MTFRITATLIAAVMAIALIACSNPAQTPPSAPDTPIPAPTAAVPPTTEAALAPQPVARTQTAPVPITAPAIQPTAPLVTILAPAPTEIPWTPPKPIATMIVVEPTAEAEPTAEPTVETPPEPTQPPAPQPTEVLPEPTATPEPTAEPTAAPPTRTPLPTPTQAPRDTSAPYIVVVDFYSGNTFNDPGVENCNPQRCGGALVQFSEPVLVTGRIVMDVLGKGIMECVEGCSDGQPSPYLIFSGVWIEAGDETAKPEILRDHVAFITDRSGNQIASYEIGPVRARPSDFAMVQGPTPVPTPIPSSVRNRAPYIRNIEYIDTTVRLHYSEPLIVMADDRSKITLNVQLEDGAMVQGACIKPCYGQDALLEFDVPGLSPDAIAISIEFPASANIRDSEGNNIDTSVEEIALAHRIGVEEIKLPPITPSKPYTRLLQFHLTEEVWIKDSALAIRTRNGVELPCYECIFGPKGTFSLIFFGWPLDDLENAPLIEPGDA